MCSEISEFGEVGCEDDSDVGDKKKKERIIHPFFLFINVNNCLMDALASFTPNSKFLSRVSFELSKWLPRSLVG